MFWFLLSAPVNYGSVPPGELQSPLFKIFFVATCVPLFVIELNSAELWFSTDAKFDDKVALPLSPSTELNHSSLFASHLSIVLCYNGSVFELTSHESSTINPAEDSTPRMLVFNKVDCPNLDFRHHDEFPLQNDGTPIIKSVGQDTNTPPFRQSAENDSLFVEQYDGKILLKSIPERLRDWLLSGQRVHVRLLSNFSAHEGLPTSAHTIPSILKVPNHPTINPGYVATVMVYVLLTCLLLFVLTSIFGLLGYIGQRIHRTQRMKWSSYRLTSATREALKKLTLRTLLPTDKEVLSGCDQCAICIELYRPSDVVRILPCRHVYHKRCIDPWLLEQYSCPLCKLDILKSCGVPVDRFRVSDHSDSVRISSEHSSSTSSGTDRFGYPVGGGPISWTRWGHRPIRTPSRQTRLASPCDHHCDRSLLRSCTRGRHSSVDQNFGHSSTNIVFGSKQQDNTTTTSNFTRPALFPTDGWTCLSHFLWLCSFCFTRLPKHDVPVCSDYCGSCSSFTRNCDIPSNDRLCSRHASVLGVSLLPNILQLAQWRWYESHQKALEHHLTDVESCRGSACIGFVPNYTAPKYGHSSRSTLWNVGLLCLPLPSRFKKRKSGNVQSSSHPICSEQKRNSSTHEITTPLQVPDTKSFGEHEAKVVIHWSKTDGNVMDADVDVGRNASISRSRVSPPCRLESYSKRLYISNERLAAVPSMVTINNTSSASSTDGSSEPSLVVLQPCMLQHAQHSSVGISSRINQRTKEQPPILFSSTDERHLIPHSFAHRRVQSKVQSRRTRLSCHPYFTWSRRRFSTTSYDHHKQMLTTSATQLPTRVLSSKFDVLRELTCFSRSSWNGHSKSPNVAQHSPIVSKFNAEARPSYQDATQDKQIAKMDVTSNLRISHSDEMEQSSNNTMNLYSPQCPMCRSERGVKLFKPISCSSAQLSKPLCPSSSDAYFSANWATGIDKDMLYCDLQCSGRRFSSPMGSIISQSFDPRVHTLRSIHAGLVQSEHDGAVAGHIPQPQLCGIRVTVEPPEVQYHHGPSNSDFSAESPAECSDSNSSLMDDNLHGYESNRSIA